LILPRALWHAAAGSILLIALSGGADGRPCEWANDYPAPVSCWSTIRKSVPTFEDHALAQRTEARMTTVEVEIDIFSGMPNPHWTLSEADTATLLSKFSELPNAEPSPRSDRLGYRGVGLIVRSAQGGASKVFVHNGVVETRDGPSVRFFGDPRRALERWLIDTGRSRLGPEVMKAIDADLQRQP
jgi:hypothetical protein